jgi:hypothetical protein
MVYFLGCCFRSGRALEPSCRHGASGWHRSKLCELPQVLGCGSEQALVSRAARTAQSEATESKDALEMGEQHLELLLAVTRTLAGRRVCQASDDITRIFVEVTRHFTLRRVRAALKAHRWQSDLLDQYNRVPSLVMPERGVA